MSRLATSPAQRSSRSARTGTAPPDTSTCTSTPSGCDSRICSIRTARRRQMRILRPIVVSAALASSAAGCAASLRGTADNIARLEQARRDHPGAHGVIRSLGIVYYQAQRLTDARAALEEAALGHSTDGVSALYLGLTAEAQNDFASARAAYSRYLRVGRTRRVRGQLESRYAALQRKELEAQSRAAVADEARLSGTPGSATVVGVLPFAFSGADTSLKPLERGFAELLTTDLSRSSRITVVERLRLQAILDELALQQSGAVAAGTGVRAGRILRAGRLVRGSINQQGNQLRADAIVVSVPTAQAEATATDAQALEQLLTLEKNIALGLFAALNIPLTTAERNAIEQRPTRSLAAFLSYSRGLELQDRGRFDDAGRSFDDAVRIDPGFSAAQQKSKDAKNAAAGAQVTSVTVDNWLRGT